ncbi:hypothetical protein D3Z38_17310 [Clostridiales bacterium]|nr:hypothetical protein [Clostridiales bacterium]
MKLGTIGKLSTLELGGCPGLKTLDLRKQTKLMELIVSGAPICELDLKKQGELRRIEISGTKLKRLDLTGTKLTKEALLNYKGHCCVDDKNIEIVFANGEKMISPVDSYDWKRNSR